MSVGTLPLPFPSFSFPFPFPFPSSRPAGAGSGSARSALPLPPGAVPLSPLVPLVFPSFPLFLPLFPSFFPLFSPSPPRFYPFSTVYPLLSLLALFSPVFRCFLLVFLLYPLAFPLSASCLLLFSFSVFSPPFPLPPPFPPRFVSFPLLYLPFPLFLGRYRRVPGVGKLPRSSCPAGPFRAARTAFAPWTLPGPGGALGCWSSPARFGAHPVPRPLKLPFPSEGKGWWAGGEGQAQLPALASPSRGRDGAGAALGGQPGAEVSLGCWGRRERGDSSDSYPCPVPGGDGSTARPSR